MFVGRIAADQQDRRRLRDIAQACSLAFVSRQRARKRNVIGRALVIDVVGSEHRARKLLQQVILFVGGVVRADDADGGAAACCRESL